MRADTRVLESEQKTRDLMDATIAGDRQKIATLFGASNGPMKDYIDHYLNVISGALKANPNHSRYKIIATAYRDEDSANGFEDDGWGWETYVRFEGSQKDIVIRVVWHGISGHHMHTGIDKKPPSASSLRFKQRLPSRSWIRAYSPDSGTILRIREVAKEKRSLMIPARFVSYDIATHNTVGVRFRREKKDGPMRIEIGPLGSKILVVGERIEP